MRKLLAGIATGAAALLLAFPAQATHSETAPYDVASTPVVSVTGTVAGIAIGGNSFIASGEQPLTIDIADASGGGVGFTVCQDVDGDGLCGNRTPAKGADEPRVVSCGTHADLADSSVAFDPNVDVTVFVRSLDNACPGEIGTSGSITLAYGL